MNKQFKKFVALCTAGVLTMGVMMPTTSFATTTNPNEEIFNNLVTKFKVLNENPSSTAASLYIVFDKLDGSKGSMKDLVQANFNELDATEQSDLSSLGFDVDGIVSLYGSMKMFLPTNASDLTNSNNTNIFAKLFNETGTYDYSKYSGDMKRLVQEFYMSMPQNFKSNLISGDEAVKKQALTEVVKVLLDDKIGEMIHNDSRASSVYDSYQIDLKLSDSSVTDALNAVKSVAGDKYTTTNEKSIKAFFKAYEIMLEAVEGSMGSTTVALPTPISTDNGSVADEALYLLNKTSMLTYVNRPFGTEPDNGGTSGGSTGGSTGGGSTGGTTGGGSTGGTTGGTTGGDTTPDDGTVVIDNPTTPSSDVVTEGTKAADKALETLSNLKNVTASQAVSTAKAVVATITKEANATNLTGKQVSQVVSKSVQVASKVVERQDVSLSDAKTIVNQIIKDSVSVAVKKDTGSADIAKVKDDTKKLVDSLVKKAGEIKNAEVITGTGNQSIIAMKQEIVKNAVAESIKAVNELKTSLNQSGLTDMATALKPQVRIQLSDTASAKEDIKVKLDTNVIKEIASANAGVTIESKGTTVNIPTEMLAAGNNTNNFEIEVINNDVSDVVVNDIAEKAKAFVAQSGLGELKSTGKVRDLDVNTLVGGVETDMKSGARPTIEMEFDQNELAGVNTDILNMYIYDPNTNGFEYVPSEFVGGRMLFEGPHFSIYAAMENDVQFADMTGHWAENTVETMAAKYVVNGRGDGKYDPQATITRAEFATILVNYLGLEGDVTFNFADVNKDAWYYNNVGIAAMNGLSAGSKDGNFMPNENITREDMALMVSRAYAIKYGSKLTGESSDFSDIDKLDAKSKEAIIAAKDNGIINGYEDKTFKPTQSATRAEAAQIIKNLIDINK